MEIVLLVVILFVMSTTMLTLLDIKDLMSEELDRKKWTKK